MPKIEKGIATGWGKGGLEPMLDAFLTDITAQKVIIDELVDDHATRVTYVGKVTTLCNELKADVNLLRNAYLNCAMGACGLAEGTNANTLKTVAAISFNINGQLYSKAITDNIAMTACALQAISTYCEYLVTIAADGTVTVTKGTEVATDVAVLPAKPATCAVIGSFKVQTDGSTTFTSGTTDLGAAGITATYKDLMFGVEAPTAIAAADLSSAVATLDASKTDLTVTT